MRSSSDASSGSGVCGLVFGVNAGFAEPRPLATAVARIATTVLTGVVTLADGVVTLTDYETVRLKTYPVRGAVVPAGRPGQGDAYFKEARGSPHAGRR